jgi:hypothetical protein
MSRIETMICKREDAYALQGPAIAKRNTTLRAKCYGRILIHPSYPRNPRLESFVAGRAVEPEIVLQFFPEPINEPIFLD